MSIEAPQLSGRTFSICCALIVLSVVSFPIYQMVDTGGWIFYTNGIDEAAYLSYPYTKVLEGLRGLNRHTNTLVRLLHEVGLSGGYINLVLDCVGTVAMLWLLPYVFRRCVSLSLAEARYCSLITFVAPLLMTPLNPLVAALMEGRSTSPLFSVTALPPNRDLIFLRSPEPQVTWIILCVLCATIGRRQMLAWVLLCVAPLLYSFVRAPVLFCALALLLPKRLALGVRLGVSFVVMAIALRLFYRYGIDSSLRQFSVHSSLPIVPLTAVVASSLLVVVRSKLHRDLLPAAVTLVASTWVGPNLQVLSGIMVSPTKYEEYWGAVVAAVLIALAVHYYARRPAYWVATFLLLFGVWVAESFRFNRAIYNKLPDPRETIAMLRDTPERVAASNIYLSVYLDMVHPRQAHTMFSLTRAYMLSGDRNYQEYRCGRDSLIQHAPEQVRFFQEEFAALEHTYRYRGADDVVTMRRRSLGEPRFEAVPHEFQCPVEVPIIVDREPGT